MLRVIRAHIIINRPTVVDIVSVYPRFIVYYLYCDVSELLALVGRVYETLMLLPCRICVL